MLRLTELVFLLATIKCNVTATTESIIPTYHNPTSTTSPTSTKQLTTINLNATTTDTNATTAYPNATTINPNATDQLTTINPNATTAYPNATTINPNATTANPNATTANPNATTANPNATTVNPNATDQLTTINPNATDPLTTTNPTDHQSTSDQSTAMYQPTTDQSTTMYQSTTDQSTAMYQPTTDQSTTMYQSTSDQSTAMYQPTTDQSTTMYQSTTDQSTTMFQFTTDQSTTMYQSTPLVESTNEMTTAAPPYFCGGPVDTFEDAIKCSSSSNVSRNNSIGVDEAPGKLTADQKVALEDFLTSIASLPTNTRLSKSETDSVATNVLFAFSKLTEPEQTLSTENEMDVVSDTEDAMKVLAGTLAPGNCTTLTKQQNSADLCSYQTVDDLKAFEFVQEVETSASSSQDSLDVDFSDFDLLPDDGNFTLVVLRKENNLNRTVFLNKTETEVAYNETTQEVNSALLTFSLFVEGNKTSVPVTFRLQHIEDTGTEIRTIDDTAFYEVRTPICTFWNEINETWSSWGCKTVFSTTNFSKCDCNHSTNFGILMDISYKETKILPEITVLGPLDWLSYIGVGVSILALVLQLTIYIYLWTMLQFDRIFIHTNLVVALLVALILFVGGVDLGNGNPVVCKIIALFLHYFYLSVFGWMLVEGVHLYMKVVKVYGSENIKMYRYILIGWVAPAVICAISFGANNEGYGSKTACWLVGDSVFSFIVPVIAVVMFNMIVFTMVIRIIMKSARLHQEKNYDHIKSGVKGALVLMPIMGMTWLFGLLNFYGDGEVFEYLFIIFNSFQGLFIFLIYCVFNSEVRAAFVRKRNKRRQVMALDSRILPMQSKVTETEFLPDPSIQIEDDGLDHEPENVPEEGMPIADICFSCRLSGHWSKDCPFNIDAGLSRIKPRVRQAQSVDIVELSRTSTPSCCSSMELPGTPSPPPVSVEPSEPDEPVATPEPIESNEPVASPEPIEQECLITPPVSPVEALVLAPCPALKPHKNISNKSVLPKNKVEAWKYW
ncbi:adhesion G protein-coupled receptor E3-like [Asterias rubens]|uniref:adhesion G protein-coupled receptor E3-like n=1 Tax=Asterias rubens TaxID=7604 RepID=UPI0014555A5B|nr:adhesion G protein-coupled receptor E3-like [Asterias rubens]